MDERDQAAPPDNGRPRERAADREKGFTELREFFRTILDRRRPRDRQAEITDPGSEARRKRAMSDFYGPDKRGR